MFQSCGAKISLNGREDFAETLPIELLSDITKDSVVKYISDH